MYICNSSFFSYEVDGVNILRGKATEIDKKKKSVFENCGMLKDAIAKKEIWFSDTIPDFFKTTNEQLDEAKNATEKVKKQLASKEKEIAELKARLASLKAQE